MPNTKCRADRTARLPKAATRLIHVTSQGCEVHMCVHVLPRLSISDDIEYTLVISLRQPKALVVLPMETRQARIKAFAAKTTLRYDMGLADDTSYRRCSTKWGK